MATVHQYSSRPVIGSFPAAQGRAAELSIKLAAAVPTPYVRAVLPSALGVHGVRPKRALALHARETSRQTENPASDSFSEETENKMNVTVYRAPPRVAYTGAKGSTRTPSLKNNIYIYVITHTTYDFHRRAHGGGRGSIRFYLFFFFSAGAGSYRIVGISMPKIKYLGEIVGRVNLALSL